MEDKTMTMRKSRKVRLLQTLTSTLSPKERKRYNKLKTLEPIDVLLKQSYITKQQHNAALAFCYLHYIYYDNTLPRASQLRAVIMIADKTDYISSASHITEVDSEYHQICSHLFKQICLALDQIHVTHIVLNTLIFHHYMLNSTIGKSPPCYLPQLMTGLDAIDEVLKGPEGD